MWRGSTVPVRPCDDATLRSGSGLADPDNDSARLAELELKIRRRRLESDPDKHVIRRHLISEVAAPHCNNC